MKEKIGHFLATLGLIGALHGDQTKPSEGGNDKESAWATGESKVDAKMIKQPEEIAKFCQTHDEGHHNFLDKNEHRIYNVDCHHSGAIQVIDYDNTEKIPKINIKTFNAPEKLTRETLLTYSKDKSVLIFGETHDKDDTTDSEKIVDLLNDLKKEGFTTVALETDKSYQLLIDNYLESESSNESLALNALRSKLGLNFSNDELLIIDSAKKLGLKILCIDNILSTKDIRDSFPKRDHEMAEKIIQEIQDGSRVIVFIGSAHARTAKTTSFQYGGDTPTDYGNGMYGQPEYEITPLARRLEDLMGADNVGSINLEKWDDLDIPTNYHPE